MLLLACAVDDSAKPEGETWSCPAQTGAWEAEAEAQACNAGGEAPLLDAALADAGLDREDFAFSKRMWNAYGAYTEDAWLTSWFTDVHHEPEQVACFTGQLDADLDTAMASAHPVSATLRAFGAQVDVLAAGDPVDPGDQDLEQALDGLIAVAGGEGDPASADELPEELRTALLPLILSITEGLEARQRMDAEVEEAGFTKTRKLFDDASGYIVDVGSYAPNLGDADEKAWWEDWYLSDESGPRSLLGPAARIAYAAEALACVAGLEAEWRFSTSAGDLVVSGPGADSHDGAEPTLLVLDLGGDDSWIDGAGATLDEDNPVSIAIDLGGNDVYGYDAVGDPNDGAGTLVSDAGGRSAASGYYVSDSEVGRQGSGRYGIGMLLDLGGGADQYASLRMGQGYGQVGIGVLYDDAGDDLYALEAAGQGAGTWGYGLLLDGGGDDQYRAWAFAQGFGYVGSGGLAYDAGGDDVWYGDPGNNYGGTTLYYSPQLAGGEGNSSFVQGAGFGMRADSWGFWLSGGLGVLRDLAGNDAYTAGVFAQGTGYAKGTGLLSDAAGDDRYDALWYVQGGSAHFAMALFEDAGGNDAYNPNFTPYNVALGSGHDGSLGSFVDEAGDDWYHSTTLALGASNCQGIGVFADNDGSDEYQADSTYAVGLGNHSGECDDSTGRTQWPSIGVFMDSGGDADRWSWTEGDSRSPADDSSFGIAWSGGDDEYGGAVDGDGESNFHAR